MGGPVQAAPAPTGQPVAVGQPRVLEGCCPGPVYVDDAQVPAGGTVTVAAGATVVAQFPCRCTRARTVRAT